ncbi:MAG: hypothetical protein COB39_08310 [Marinosulfonomonas sp.]|nr:MAG: hypothetical protein COB39_08310 [Marinosulfonomonas sp.]
MTMTTCNTPARTIPKQRPSMFRVIEQIFATQGQRRALRQLDSAALADLGLSYADAKREAGRPFWDVPATWRQ